MTTPFDAGTTRIAAFDQGIRIPSIELVVIEGPSRGARVRIQGGMAKVGSAPQNHLALQDPTVSRVHCELRVRPDGVAIKDCDSTNGTFVDGVRIRDGEIQPGAAVRVGKSAFRLESTTGTAFLPISDSTSFGELVG